MSDPASSLRGDPDSIWGGITALLRDDIPKQTYLTWFEPIEALELHENCLTLSVPSKFYKDWIESHYSSHLHRLARIVLGFELSFEFLVQPNGRAPETITPRTHHTDQPVKGNLSRNFETHLNLRLKFSNFVVGDCNKFACAAAVALAESPGKTAYNPLLIHGGSGLGKTHLMNAIGNAVVESDINCRVLYVTSEQFTTDFIDYIKSGHSSRSNHFSKTYRSVDVLLVDDVHFFMAKDKTQEEFFHTFNFLHQSEKQLVLSSDRPPSELEGFNKRLVSRLQWGLVSELRMPDYETRLAILMHRAEEDGIKLLDDVAHYLAMNISDNIRSLQGALVQLIAQSQLLGKTISVDLASEVVKNFVDRAVKVLSVSQIQELVAGECNLQSDLLRSRTRKRNISEARQIAMYLCTEYTNSTLKAIGLHFGGRDHATVIHARGIICKRIENDEQFSKLVSRIVRKLEHAML